MRREGETKQRTGGGGGGGGLGPPDLDLDVVEVEAQEEEQRRREDEERRRREERKREEEERRREEERQWQEEERRRRSQTVRQKEKRDDQREQGRRSRSLPRVSARSWDMLVPEVEVEEERRRMSETKSRRRPTEADREGEKRGEGGERRKVRDVSTTRHAKHSGSSAPAQRAAFSFLMPMDEDDERQHLSDSESAASFSEVSLSAASIATAGWRDDSDWRRGEQGKAPGPWLKPSPQKLTRVLIGSRLNGRELVGGLSL